MVSNDSWRRPSRLSSKFLQHSQNYYRTSLQPGTSLRILLADSYLLHRIHRESVGRWRIFRSPRHHSALHLRRRNPSVQHVALRSDVWLRVASSCTTISHFPRPLFCPALSSAPREGLCMVPRRSLTRDCTFFLTLSFCDPTRAIAGMKIQNLHGNVFGNFLCGCAAQ